MAASKMTKMLSGVAVMLALGQSSDLLPKEEVKQAFEQFQKDFNKSYDSESEKEGRFVNFVATYKRVMEHNSLKNTSFKMAITKFADLSRDEFTSRHTGLRQRSKPFEGLKKLGTHKYSGKELPRSVDWVKEGAVTRVRNQGDCGSCWTFSTIGAIEGAWAVETGNLIEFSEQQLLDCARDKHEYNSGCNGGDQDAVFEYYFMREEAPVCTQKSYPYTGKSVKSLKHCNVDNCEVGIPSGGIVGYKDVDRDEKAIMEALTKAPLAVSMDADSDHISNYDHGVLTKHCGHKLDHAVLLVGYGTNDDGIDYWKLKNSWGKDWGEDGYFRIVRSSKHGPGKCGVRKEVILAKVEDDSKRSSIVV
eukprot:TRINITY_DN5264_c3_g1_i1.p1 TRINITY_DN5264_c3_g1~~TRINITY_DN5264_c3_g1_i1.p1  ORF type:complete len:361 (+),score=67.87 TRINITY_DN5264_c3_g1_i1:95-1177(+)